MDLRYSKGTSYDSRSGGARTPSKFKEKFKATCASCKKDCEVPFEPTEGKKVYCRECYAKRNY